MNRHRFTRATVVGILAAALALTVTGTALAQPGGRRNGPGFGNGPAAGTTATTALTEAEAASLLFMHEEEKLARDVYLALFEQWNLVIFENIATSEQNHMDAIGRLLSKYGIEDLAYNDDPGYFSNEALHKLYPYLVEKGKVSADDALLVGVEIEETDIDDLEEVLAETSRRDIKRVYTNLLDGSYNHLEAFESGCDILAAAQ